MAADPRGTRLRRYLLTLPGVIRRDTGDGCLAEARAQAGMVGVPMAEFTKMLAIAGHSVRNERIINGVGKATGKYRAVLMLPS